jgi:uroporphyrinogen decarboxylase
MVTPKERILKVLAFEEADIVPYHIACDEQIISKIKPHLEQKNLLSRFTNHLPFYNFEAQQTWISSHSYRDEFGTIWEMLNGVPHLVDYPLKDACLKSYHLPDFSITHKLDDIQSFILKEKDHFILCGFAQGFFDRGWALRGFENFMMDFVENPSFIHQIFEELTEYYIKLIDSISIFPFNGIRFGDDWGTQRGLMIGTRHWRKFIKPGLKRIFEKARQKGLAVMVHSDGDIFNIIPDLLDIGVQILNPVQPEAMDICAIKRLYGQNLCMNGGISSQYTLPWGTPSDVYKEVNACIKYLARGGGFVIGPTKSILPETPVRNIVTLFESILDQSTKPLGLDEVFPDHIYELERVYISFRS